MSLLSFDFSTFVRTINSYNNLHKNIDSNLLDYLEGKITEEELINPRGSIPHKLEEIKHENSLNCEDEKSLRVQFEENQIVSFPLSSSNITKEEIFQLVCFILKEELTKKEKIKELKEMEDASKEIKNDLLGKKRKLDLTTLELCTDIQSELTKNSTKRKRNPPNISKEKKEAKTNSRKHQKEGEKKYLKKDSNHKTQKEK